MALNTSSFGWVLQQWKLETGICVHKMDFVVYDTAATEPMVGSCTEEFAMRNAPRHAFTLVELLVVIGIIAVLVAILLPSLAKARVAAVRVQCLSNLRQCAMGIQAYSQDYNGAILIRYQPLGGHYHSWGGTLMYGYENAQSAAEDTPVLPRYMNTQVARCPMDPYRVKEMEKIPTNPFSNGMDQFCWATYAIFTYDSANDPRTWDFQKRTVLVDIGTDKSTMDTQKLNRVPRPGEMIMLADSRMSVGGPDWWCGPNWSTHIGQFYFNSCGIWTAHGIGGRPNFTGAVHGSWLVADSNYDGAVANVAFYDGHAESRSVKELREGLQDCHYFWDLGGTGTFWVN